MLHKFYFSNHAGDFRNKTRILVVYFSIHLPSSLEVPGKQTNKQTSEQRNKGVTSKEANKKRRTPTKQQTQKEANMKTSNQADANAIKIFNLEF